MIRAVLPILLLFLGFNASWAQSAWWIFTSKGRIKIETREDLRPNTSKQFSQWVEEGIYTGKKWQTIRKDSTIQTESLASDPYTKTDPDTTLKFDRPGVLAFTKDAGGRFTGAFKIQMIASPKADRSLPIFGRVVIGMQTVYAINQAPADAQGVPAEPVSIDSIRPENPDKPLSIPPGLESAKVRFYTRLGTFTLKVHDDKVPITAINFLKLIKDKYYDGNPWNRIVPNFVNQTGPRSGQAVPARLPEDYHPGLRHDGMSVSMATSGAGTGTSHFAIQVVATPHLNDKYSLFAHVVEGADVVLKINKLPTNANETPVTPILTDSARILPASAPSNAGAGKSLTGMYASLAAPRLSPDGKILTITSSSRSDGSKVELSLFGITGRRIPLRPIGNHGNEFAFGTEGIPAGIYYYRVKAGAFSPVAGFISLYPTRE